MPVSPYPSEYRTAFPTPLSENRQKIIENKCGIYYLERSRDILSILSLISNPVDLVTPTTAQYKARYWLDNKDGAVLCTNSAAHIGQRYRLALLYYSLGGPHWYNCRAKVDASTGDVCVKTAVRSTRMLAESNLEAREVLQNRDDSRLLQGFTNESSVRWLDASNECAWFGLDCGNGYAQSNNTSANEFFPVIDIDLGSNNLMGTFVSELFGFPSLQGYFLDGNLKISGPIPDALGNLTNLKYLDFNDNALTGPLPSTLYNLVDLIVIDLDANQLTGTLSPSIGNITGLEVLQLANNMMSGPLPVESLLNLMKLGTCHFSYLRSQRRTISSRSDTSIFVYCMVIVAFSVEGNLFTGTLEPLCAVREERRQNYGVYLQFIFAECGGGHPLVNCTCCVCY